MRSALHLRRSLSIAREDAVNVYDVAAAIGVDVRFQDLPSLEGMFVKDPGPAVLLPSRQHRPRGRISFSCAHELGHFQLGHGTKVDEYVDADQSAPKSEEEYAADTFASTLLMPRQAVLQRFAVRERGPIDTDTMTLFVIAGELDVGYSTLISHLRYGLEIVTDTWLSQRQKVTPKQIKSEISDCPESAHVVVVTEHWPKVPVDLEVGDVLAVPAESVARPPSQLASLQSSLSWHLFRAASIGVGNLHLNSVICTVRVARAGYCGSLRYRYLTEPEDE